MDPLIPPGGRCRPAVRIERARRRGQAGTSLIEVLVALAVAVPVTLAGAAGLLTAVETSAVDERRQLLEVELTTATEQLKALPYVACGDADDYGAALASVLGDDADLGDPPGGGSIVVDDVEYWDRARVRFDDRCIADAGAQRVTVTADDGERSRVARIVLRDPSASPGVPR